MDNVSDVHAGDRGRARNEQRARRSTHTRAPKALEGQIHAMAARRGTRSGATAFHCSIRGPPSLISPPPASVACSRPTWFWPLGRTCLLYTSDAADDM
eukprot:14828055-Alexandrium_andersonii.AAC.1